MPPTPIEVGFTLLALALRAGAILLVAGACTRAIVALAAGHEVDHVRMRLAGGLVEALMPLTMAAVVGTLVLARWQGLALAGVVFGLRLIMKASLEREQDRLQERSRVLPSKVSGKAS